MADGHNDDDGADVGQGIYDPFLVPDDFDDVLYLLDMNGGMDPPPLPAPAMTAGPSASGNNNLLERPLDINDDSVGNRATTHSVPLAEDPTSGRAQDVGSAATSATAPRSSSSAAVHQNALDCTGCLVLREVVHCNGLEASKLSIHGVGCLFHHATLEVYRIDSNGLAAVTMTTQLTHQSYVEGRDYVWVKRYLTDYARQRAGGGYIVLQDSISAFQDALCTSMFCGSGHADVHRETLAGCPADDGGAVQASATMVEDPEGRNDVAAEPSAETGPSEPIAKEQGRRPEILRAAKSALAIQRERASNLQLDDIARYFHLPMVEAAKELRICATVLKGTSRKFNIRRWPYRKIKSIDSQIAKLRRGNGDPSVMREIERLTGYRRRIYAGLE